MASPFFLKNLIKGKAAETVVFEMFQEVSRFIVMPFGSETILPDSKTLTYKVDEYSDVALIKMTIQLKMLQEYDTAENKNLWKVVLEAKLN